MTAVAAHCTGFVSGALRYAVTDEAAMTVCADSLTDNTLTELIIPETVENDGKTYTVTAVDIKLGSRRYVDFSSKRCKVDSIAIPRTVTDIICLRDNGNGRRCKVTFAEGSQLKAIHAEAFLEFNIPEIDLPASVETIGEKAFQDSRIEEINISNVKKIAPNTFNGCSSLTYADLGNAEEISDSAFYDCRNLTSVTMNNVRHVGYQAFTRCESLNIYQLPKTLESIYGYAFPSQRRTITLPASVDTVGYYGICADEIYPQGDVPARIDPNAFGYNPTICVDAPLFKTYSEAPVWKDLSLKVAPFEVGNVTYEGIADGEVAVKEVHQTMADELIVIPATVEYGGFTFAVTKINDYSLENALNLEINAPVETLGFQTERGERPSGSGWRIRSIKLPSTLKRIEDYTFHASRLREIDLPESLEYIGESAFGKCDDLKSISIPASVKTIGENAFRYCRYITTATVSAEEIGEGAFSNCRMLETLTLNEGVKKIGTEIISGTERLTELYLPASVEKIGTSTTYTTGYTDTKMLICRDSKCEAIRVSEANPYYKDIDGVLFNKAGTSLFEYPCGRKAGHYDVPAGVSVIDAYAFSHCMELHSVGLPEGLRSIRNSAFDLTGLCSTVTLPESLDSLGCNSFWEYNSSIPPSFPVLRLSSQVPPKVRISLELENTEPNDNYLSQKTPIKDVRYVCVPAEAYEAYMSDKFWSRLNIVTEFDTDGNFVYEPVADGKTELVGCHKAVEGSVNVPATVSIDGSDNTVAIIGKRAFCNNSAITEAILPETVEEIADSAFYGCTALRSINILQNPAETAQNAAHAPYQATAQKSALKRIGASALYDTALESLYIPEHTMLTMPHCIFTDSLRKIEVDALNPYYRAEDGVLYNAAMDTLLIYPSAKETTVFILPETVTALGYLDSTPGFRDKWWIWSGNYGNVPANCYVFAPTPPENHSGFYDRNATLYVRTSALEAYQNTEYWSYFGNIVGMSDEEIEQFVTGINGVHADGICPEAADGTYYTIGGMSVKAPAKGLYIHDGRKVVVK